MLLLFAFWLLCDFFLLSVWQKTAQPLRSSFLLQGAIDRLFWQLRGRCTLLDSSSNFKNSTTKQILKFTFFWCWWLVKNYLQVNKSNFSFFSYFVGTWKQDKRFISSKKFNEITIKVRANIYYLFIYLFIFYLFIYFFFFFILLAWPFCFFYNSKLGPHLLPLRVPHRHIRFCLFHESSNMAHEIHFPTEFSSNPNQTPRAC